jgi:ABC-2 type transport system permease protein
VVVGLAILQVLASTLGLMPGQVRQELVAGTMERFIVSSFGPTNGIAAMLIFPLISSLISAFIMLTIAAVVFGLPISITAPLAIPVALLGSLAFVPFALGLTATVIVVKQATAGTQYVMAAIAIVGGLYFPISRLPSWLHWTSQVQPFSPAADLLRHLLVGTSLQYSVFTDLLKMVGFAALLFPFSLILVRRAIRLGQRRGTIIEY